MDKQIIDSITIDSICSMLTENFEITYTEIANALGKNQKTLNRWRNGESHYRSMSKSSYRLLFSLINDLCLKNDISFEELVTDWFSEIPQSTPLKGLYQIITDSLDFHIDINNYNVEDKSNQILLTSAEVFIRNSIESDKLVECIYMSFHSGWEWLRDKHKRQILDTINDLEIPLYIIANPAESIEMMAKNMHFSKEEKFYAGYNEGLRLWNRLSDSYKNLFFRVSKYPLMRRLFYVRFADDTCAALSQDYIYNCPHRKHPGNLFLNESSPVLPLLISEFDFLWENGHSYNDWYKNSLHLSESELFPVGDYVLFNLSPQKEETSLLVSSFHVEKNNQITLESNSFESFSLPLKKQEPEFHYSGRANITRNNIFLTLSSKECTEEISIIISRPLHDKKRYLGIMTTLTPQAQPIAFKCAIIEESQIKQVNQKLLKSILLTEDLNNKNGLLTLEETKINQFYSNDIIH